MRASLKCCLFMVFFSSFVFVYLSLPYLTPPIRIVPDGLIFGKGRVGFLFMIIVFMTSAFIVTTFVHCGCHVIRKIISKKNRIGETFVSIGLITQDELAAALSTRKLKIGEILKNKVLMAKTFKETVPSYLKNNYVKMGEMLVKIGFSTDDEIQWALNQKRKRIEKVSKENKLII